MMDGMVATDIMVMVMPSLRALQKNIAGTITLLSSKAIWHPFRTTAEG
jgi:hypothetical protein